MRIRTERTVAIPVDVTGTSLASLNDHDEDGECRNCGGGAHNYSRARHGWIWVSCPHCGYVCTAIRPDLKMDLSSPLGSTSITLIITMSWKEVDKMLNRAFGIKDIVKNAKGEADAKA